ncbi:MAG: hypothetical protein H6658_05565 [Ardenticatenaceae bacterium]|nr:hypothetical protein [Ardenticatenaceae bacterium]
MDISLKELKQNEVKIVPEVWYGRLFYAFVTIITPVIAFAMQHGSPLGMAEWQSGFDAYMEILLGGDINRLFYPFIVYAIISMILLLAAPQRFAPNFAIRLGIYTGTLLVVQYVVMLLAATYFLFALMMGVPATLVVYGLYRGYGWAVKRWGRRGANGRLLALLAAASVVLALFDRSFFSVPLAVWMAGFCWILPLTAVTSYRLWTTYETPKLWQMPYTLGVGVWLGGYIFTWTHAISKMTELYATLPDSPPNCYIATAAAQGHPQFVGSQKVGCVLVNRQLQTLKAAEVVLLVLAPRGHRWLRRGYDVYGRLLATKLTNPYLADLAYLTLKPLEWGSWLLLSLVVPNVGGWIGRFYSQRR